ncbi:MAG: DUF1848 domain-containing protein, partial [Treponema sp.]|nr:DUF1848 domain-containing protein [Treponema sp.]
MIISVSRRCDIPRFRFGWFLERLNQGFAETANPFNRSQIRRVSLLPEDAEVLVFWTRDPGAILENLEHPEIRGRRFYVMATLTGYPRILEPNPPAPERVIAAIRGLGEKLGPPRIIWRYDPLFLSSLTDLEFHLANFRSLAEALKGRVRRVIISLYDEYPGAQRRIAALERAGSFRVLPLYGDGGLILPEIRELLRAMARIAAEAGMEIQSCAEEEDLAVLGIRAGACLDGELIRELWGIETGGKDKNQRPRCRCVPSTDIGSYGPCPAGCVYCYALR